MKRVRIRRSLSVLALVAWCFLEVQRATAQAQTPPRITRKVLETELTTLPGTTRIARLATADEGSVPDDQMLQHMILLLKPSEEQGLQALLSQQYDPSSPRDRACGYINS